LGDLVAGLAKVIALRVGENLGALCQEKEAFASSIDDSIRYHIGLDCWLVTGWLGMQARKFETNICIEIIGKIR
jgi:hypothetical protein